MRSDLQSASATSLFRLRLEGLKAYGGKCICCGEVRAIFLTFDHTVPVMRQSLVDNRSTSDLLKNLAELRRLNWPESIYQIMCMNCNYAKGKSKQCDHSEATVDELLTSLPRKKRGRTLSPRS